MSSTNAKPVSHVRSNDSLRAVLVRAAALDGPNGGTGALMGYEIAGTVPNAPQGEPASAIAALRTLAQTRPRVDVADEIRGWGARCAGGLTARARTRRSHAPL